MTTFNNITEAFGNTPLVRINAINDGAAGNVYAKLEFYNPSSSVKDRLGIAMIDAAEASGALKPGGTIVEATSGNTGIAVAMVAAARGYKSIFTMPESVSKERRKLIRAFGAELVLTPAGEGMKGAVAAAEKLGESGAVLVRQFENEAGPAIHYKTTGPEIWRDLDGKVDAFVSGIGTGGTISGIINSALPHQKILGFPALKGDFLQDEIRNFVQNDNWELITDYHFGGYGKVNSDLVDFINRFLKKTKIPLDPIYTGKMVFGIVDLIEKNYFPENSKILLIHTGGLQGIQGMNLKLKNKGLPILHTHD